MQKKHDKETNRVLLMDIQTPRHSIERVLEHRKNLGVKITVVLDHFLDRHLLIPKTFFPLSGKMRGHKVVEGKDLATTTAGEDDLVVL